MLSSILGKFMICCFEVQIHKGSDQDKFIQLEEKCGFLEEIGRRREKEITKLKAKFNAPI